MYGAIEFGETKTHVAVGEGQKYAAPVRIDTSEPATTVAAARGASRSLSGSANRLDGIGIASFGSLDISDGTLLDTPKTGWSGAAILDPFAVAFGCPVRCDTDVNAAAIAEGLWGSTVGLGSHAYLTIGTGVGVGIAVDGRPVHGQMHPEAGHIIPRLQPNDTFGGVCRWHNSCFEGLISGPAVLSPCGFDPADLEADAPIWELVGDYVGKLAAIVALTTSVEAVVVSGGVGRRPAVLAAARTSFRIELGGYLPRAVTSSAPEFLRAAELDDYSGLLGALTLGSGMNPNLRTFANIGGPWREYRLIRPTKYLS